MRDGPFGGAQKCTKRDVRMATAAPVETFSDPAGMLVKAIEMEGG
jgi:hypothetical protein